MTILEKKELRMEDQHKGNERMEGERIGIRNIILTSTWFIKQWAFSNTKIKAR